LNCEINKKLVFIQILMHKNACNEQFLSTFAAQKKENAFRTNVCIEYGIISMA
jgi:hypothetical protein